MKKSIWCTFRIPGVHYWPNAKNYLQYPHRHLFHFRVEMSVTDSDREFEFIAFGRNLQYQTERGIFGTEPVTFSCETIAEKVVRHLIEVFGDRDYTVEVSEDGENGATISRNCSTC